MTSAIARLHLLRDVGRGTLDPRLQLGLLAGFFLDTCRYPSMS